MDLDPNQVRQFLDTLLTHYDTHGRHDLPWRQTTNPYHIVVSELMLQQTQVGRVIPKYRAFLAQFPDVKSLANSKLGDVLVAWQGLGYNRRAQYLWRTAQRVQDELNGRFPETQDALVSLPGIGSNTAGAILAYAYDTPVVFVETNIRSVIIHHFFEHRDDVSDSEIMHVLRQLLPDTSARVFYWAMMDYGSYLKQTVGNNVARSRHYVRQSAFQGSRRQLRGFVMRSLAEGPKTEAWLYKLTTDGRLLTVLGDLEQEGLIAKQGEHFELA